MIQVYSCNLLSSVVMTDGLFERVSVFVMIPCFLKNGVCLFVYLTALSVCFPLLSFNTIYCLICLEKWSKCFFILGLYVQMMH